MARKLAMALAALLLVGVFAAGLGAGRAWARVRATTAALDDERERLREIDFELAALHRRMERHAEAERRLAEQALDCRIAAAYRHGGKRVELVLQR